MTWSQIERAAANSVWPMATLDTLGRARAIAAGLSGVAIHETRIDAPFADVWRFISDLERSVPIFDASVRSYRITRREGTRLRANSYPTIGFGLIPFGCEIELEDGWCWIMSRPRGYVVCMAAAPDPDSELRTRYVHVEGVARAGRRIKPLLRGTRRLSQRHVANDVAAIVRALGTTSG